MLTLPNQLTLFRIFLMPLFVFLIFLEGLYPKIALVIVFILASLTDWYDGYTARRFGYVTKWGQFLDPLADKIFITAGFVCFSILGYIQFWMVLVICARDILITALRFYGVIKGKPLVTNLFAKTKTCMQFVVICFVLIVHLYTYPEMDKVAALVWSGLKLFDLIYILMALTTLLTIISGCIYLIENRIRIKEMFYDICRIFTPSNV
jgi:CDP-diacylglycerol--glycerol-3-phosphate 3-phosphatidyltransferase